MKKVLLTILLVSLCFSFEDISSKQTSLHTHVHSHIFDTTVHEHTHVDISSNYLYFSKEENSFKLVVKDIYFDVDKNIPLSIRNSIFRPPIS